MGNQRIRKKRQRALRKPDAVIISLTSLTIILLLVWGGLYWKESSGRALIVQANEEYQVDQSLQEDDGLQTPDSALNSGMNEQSSVTGETVVPVEQSDDKASVDGEVPQLQELPKPTQETVAKPETQSPAKLETQSPATATQNPAKPETQSPAEPETQSTAKTDSPSKAETDSPGTNPSDPPISQAQQYEEEIIQVQAMCRKDMKEILSGAESSIQQAKTDPYAFQAWEEKWTKEIATAETKCDDKFQEVSQNAENDSVSLEVIAEWQQTFSALKVKLQEESQAKLQLLMRG